MKQNMSLRNRFIATSYASIAISVILISLVSYVLLSSNSKKFAISTNQAIASQKGQSIGMRMDGLEVTLRDIIYSAEQQQLLSEYAADVPKDILTVRTLVNRAIAGATNSLTMLDNVVIFSKQGDMIGSMLEFNSERKIQSYKWYEEISPSQGETCWLSDSMKSVKDNYGSHLELPAIKKIRSLYAKNMVGIGDDIGYLYITLNLDSCLDFVQADYSPSGRKVLIVNEDNRIIGGNCGDKTEEVFDGAFLNEKVNNTYITYQGERYLYTYKRVDTSTPEWYVVCLTPQSAILKNAKIASGICLLVSFVLLVVFGVISVHNANSLSKPIELLEKNFEMVEQGAFDIKIQGHTNIREINRLFARFHVMVYRLDTLINEVCEAQIKEQKLVADARQAEIQALQMQINPHFLYNTLDSINWMALMQGNQDVSKMTIALGHLFRSNMNTTGIYTTMKEELENMKLFMYLEQVRFGDKLVYTVEADEQAMEASILKHLLQPLVENSLKHGIEPYSTKGEILICVQREGDTVVVVVSDNGKGMAVETLEKIRSQWEHRESIDDRNEGGTKGVGLDNIIKRLTLCYGKQVSFQITSNSAEGTRTMIQFPFETGKEKI